MMRMLYDRESLLKEYSDNYRVENNGQVWSYTKQKYLKPKRRKDGYLEINLWNHNKGKSFLIHDLVAIVYIPNPNNLPQVNHKDEDKTNNRVENLE